MSIIAAVSSVRNTRAPRSSVRMIGPVIDGPNFAGHSGARRSREPGIHYPRLRLWIPDRLAALGVRNDEEIKCPSRLHLAALQREQAARALLDEQDDENENRDLGDHRARIRLQELVGDA